MFFFISFVHFFISDTPVQLNKECSDANLLFLLCYASNRYTYVNTLNDDIMSCGVYSLKVITRMMVDEIHLQKCSNVLYEICF